MSFKVAPELRRAIELLAAKLTVDGDKKYTMTDVVETAVLEMADRRGIKRDKASK